AVQHRAADRAGAGCRRHGLGARSGRGGGGRARIAPMRDAQSRSGARADGEDPRPHEETRKSQFLLPYAAGAQQRSRGALAGTLGAVLPVPSSNRTAFNSVMCDVVEETKPDVVSFHFGLPEAGLLQRLKAGRFLVMSSATTAAEARWLEARGVDAV